MSKSILLIGSFSGENYGDTIVLKSLLEYLRGKGFSDIYIPAANPQKTKEVLDRYVDGVKIIYIDVNMRRTFGYRFFNINVLKVLNKVDFIALTAGTIFFRDLTNPRRNFVFSVYLMSWILRLFRVKTVGLFVGINEALDKFSGLKGIISRHFFRTFSHIITRDLESFSNLKKSIDRVKISRSYDIAFYNLLCSSNHRVSLEKFNSENPIKTVGINVCEYLGKQVGQDVDEMVLANFLDQVCERFSTVLWFHTTKRDEDFVKQLISKTRLTHLSKGQHLSLYQDLTLEDYYKKINYFVGMRMHSLIPAISYRIPAIALNYNDKVKGLFTQLDGGHFVLDFDGLQNIDVSEVVKNGFLIRDEQRENIISNVNSIEI